MRKARGEGERKGRRKERRKLYGGKAEGMRNYEAQGESSAAGCINRVRRNGRVAATIHDAPANLLFQRSTSFLSAPTSMLCSSSLSFHSTSNISHASPLSTVTHAIFSHTSTFSSAILWFLLSWSSPRTCAHSVTACSVW